MSYNAYPSENNPTSGHPTPGGNPPNKSHQIQQELDEVVNIMQDNIDKVMEREERLDVLHSKTDDMNEGARQFRKGASRVRKQMWWKDMKLKIIIAVVIIILLVIIIVPLATKK
ncbi:synaptobrevin-domain-containing protein [Dimargaris cristalligena]|uniref:Synaptobrevin-domain-containing protein n=1 Tax=Dimargaris cristalligena TaxID=215637 RepID=A0A4P9ZS22_9FUNG|nr:synaptobrevin-domain-containing protein [Dimargaris cristalligena]|eukprot:RKP36195.1 synaptobrevin-domain-containing protein [Dimargaris cristalligena]